METPRLTVMDLADKITTEAEAYKFLEDLRWGDKPVCAHCGSDRVFFLNPENGVNRKTRTGAASERRVWKCGACRQQFSVITNTVMHGTKIAIRKWLFVIVELCSAKNGVAAREIERRYDLTAKSAWFMLHRIREAMKREPLVGMLSGTIQADETFIGGKPKNKHRQGKAKGNGVSFGHGSGAGAGGNDKKVPVLSLINTATGEVRSQVIPNASGPSLRKAITAEVDLTATTLHTDGWHGYRQLGKEAKGHEFVDHSSHEYVRYSDEGHISTNAAEGYFSQLKRSIDGTHHHVSPHHLPRYLAEFDYRYTTRKISDVKRTERLIGQMDGKRLTYRPIAER